MGSSSTVAILLCLSVSSFFYRTRAESKKDFEPYVRKVSLDSRGRYDLVWEVNWMNQKVTFNVTAATNGYVGFGLAKKQKMAGADIVIGGVNENGHPYFKDHYAIANQSPQIDPNQDWILHSAWERNNKTFLSFSRAFDTCDENFDLSITDDMINIIWAYGERDDISQYHYQQRGGYAVYLLDPNFNPFGNKAKTSLGHGRTPSGKTQMFEITKSMPVPPMDTMYWCIFHKVPTTFKHHIIGFNVTFPTKRDRNHIHHMLLQRCVAPPGINDDLMFGPASRSEGSECFHPEAANRLPTPYCREAVYSWGVGGREFFLPEHVGIPMSEEGSEYFMAQLHIDNPNVLTNSNFTVTMQVFYTTELRKHDLGLLGLGNPIPTTTAFVIPPNSLDFITMGMCAPACTANNLPSQGVNIVAGWMHTHTTGHSARIRQIRGDKELPWVLFDDNYDPTFQQFRNLREEIKILPRDQLILRCVFDNTHMNGSASVGGFSTRDDMCSARVYYYPRQKGFSMCRSELRAKEYLHRLQIGSIKYDTSRYQLMVASPSEYSGLTVLEHVNSNVNWNQALRGAIQGDHLWQSQVTMCSNTTGGPSISQWQLGEYMSRGRFPAAPSNPSNEHESINPRNVQRYKRPLQCSRNSFERRNWMISR